MIDMATCNAQHLGGCANQSPPAVAVGVGPDLVAVNELTHTAYVSDGNINDNSGHTLSVFDTSSCNATTQKFRHGPGRR
jgi:hypothetical protein